MKKQKAILEWEHERGRQAAENWEKEQETRKAREARR